MEDIYVNHKYRDEIIIPFLGLTPNFDFSLLSDKEKEGKIVKTRDGVRARITKCSTTTIFSLEMDIRRIYGVSVWEYLCKWNEACEGQLTSLYLWNISLERVK